MIAGCLGRAVILAALVATVAACGMPATTDEHARPVLGGTPAPDDPTVVALVTRRLGCTEIPTVICTGVIAAPRVVLTAAHCLDDLDRDVPAEVYVGDHVGADPEEAYRVVSAWRRHPTGDVAVVALAEPLPVAAAALNDQPIDQLALGTTVRVVGFGVDEAGQVMGDGLKRQGTMQVVRLEPTELATRPFPGSSCRGDSGGPVLADLGAGERVIALTSRGDAACGGEAIAARVDVVLAELVTPFVAEVDAMPSGRPDGTVPRAEACTAPCIDDGDCPDLERCTELAPGELRCTLQSAPPRELGDECADDSTCGSDEVCGRVWSHGADVCRCARSCVEEAPPGCCSGSNGGTSSALVLFLYILFKFSSVLSSLWPARKVLSK